MADVRLSVGPDRDTLALCADNARVGRPWCSATYLAEQLNVLVPQIRQRCQRLTTLGYLEERPFHDEWQITDKGGSVL